MATPLGFLHHQRDAAPKRDASHRLADYQPIEKAHPLERVRRQAARCMDCGVPFCQSDDGCPLHNRIPEWNELLHRERLEAAVQRLLLTNPFPEFTGRICPAPCEGVCTLGSVDRPVTIRQMECTIIDRAFEQGLMRPRRPEHRTGRTVAVIGSGPAGLAAADRLNKLGHRVVVFEKDDRIGGLLTYGIPNMKLDKAVVDRRVELLRQEGVQFITGAAVGENVAVEALRKRFDCLLLCLGSSRPRDLDVPGRHLEGIDFAMDYLVPTMRSLLDSNLGDGRYLSAAGRRVIVIGGGDTGNDCIATAVRHGCASVCNIELLEKPPDERGVDNPWPQPPRIGKLDYGHEEAIDRFGGDPRHFGRMTTAFEDDGHGRVGAVRTVAVHWRRDAAGRQRMVEMPGSERLFEADMVLLALGFVGPDRLLIDRLGLATDARQNIDTRDYATSVPGIFAAGDCRRGQSLVVWAIAEGLGAADAIERHLMGERAVAPEAAPMSMSMA